MQPPLFVWLGSKRAQKYGVVEKGVLLDLATRAGLPVPSGGILLDEFYRLALEDGLFVEDNGRIFCPDSHLLHKALYYDVRFPKLEKPVVVQPLLDGHFPPQQNIHFTNPIQLAQSLSEAYSVIEPESGRRDVIVMEMVATVVVGTAVTQTTQPTDTITYNEQSLTLPQLNAFQSASPNVPPFTQRLQKLLRGIRRTFGKGNWVIEWVDDGEVCWLTQITRLRTRELT